MGILFFLDLCLYSKCLNPLPLGFDASALLCNLKLNLSGCRLQVAGWTLSEAPHCDALRCTELAEVSLPKCRNATCNLQPATKVKKLKYHTFTV